MRIGVDATALYGRYGGVEYSIWNLLCALHEEDSHNEYFVYIPRNGPSPSQLKNFGARWRWIRLPFRGKEKLRRILWQQLVLSRRLRRDGCNLLHAPNYVLPICNSRVPAVLTVYDLIALDAPHFATRANRLHYGLVLPRSIQKAKCVIVPSEVVRDAIVSRAPHTKEKIRVVPLGVEPIFFQEPNARTLQEVRARYRLPEKFLLFVGNFEPKKNLKNIFKALELLPDAPPLVVVGGARAWHPIESPPRVRVLGYVPRKDLPALYSSCAVFVFPSLAEGFGLPVLEAMACGAATVTSGHVALPNLENVVVCEPRKPVSIADAIRRVLADKNLRARLQRDGLEYSRSFTWQRTARETLEIYGEAG